MCTVDEPVFVTEYRSAWPSLFASEQRRICVALGVSPSDLEHIGSTAVPGLVAKPTIDLMLGVHSMPPPALMARITQLGYEALGEADVPGRLYFRLRGALEANLHVVLKGGSHWVNNLALREYLRSNAAARARYAQAKLAAISCGASTLLAYSAAKASAISGLLEEAFHGGCPWRGVAEPGR